MRLIDADKLRENWLYGGENEYIYNTNDVLESIDEQPTIETRLEAVIVGFDCNYETKTDTCQFDKKKRCYIL